MRKIENTLIDNSKDFLLVNYLCDIIDAGECNHIKIATGYWDLPGTKLLYDQLKPFLAKGGRLDIMIGQEPQLRTYQLRDDLPEEEAFPDFYIQRDVNKLNDDYLNVAQLLLDYINPEDEDNSQIRIRVYGQDTQEKQFLHAKCYIFLGSGCGKGIVGSSNFTEKGLQENAELNYLEINPQNVTSPITEYNHSKSHLVWFNEKWEQSLPWSGKFIMEILMKSPVGQKAVDAQKAMNFEQPEPAPLTPYELYIKLLQTKFGDLVDKNLDEVIESYLPDGIDKYNYQIDAVKQCFSTMKEHGGFLLADVVGLGKTIVGSLVIKHFLQFPDDDGRERKVLIITPPAIKSAWVDTIEVFDKDATDKMEDYIDYITTGSIGKLVDDVEGNSDGDDDSCDSGDFEGELLHENYGLIIIDESHKFRNSGTNMY